jgi:hypothetical protein
MLGSPTTARRWLFAGGGTSNQLDEWLVVRNPGPSAATVAVTVLAGRPLPLQSVDVPAGGRVAVRLGDRVQQAPLPLVVEATRPVVVERSLYRVGRDAVGLSAVLGVPWP